LEAARRDEEEEEDDFDFDDDDDFRFPELGLSSCSPSEVGHRGSSSSWRTPGTLGGFAIRKPGMHAFVV
jgi:hypothetical protein